MKGQILALSTAGLSSGALSGIMKPTQVAQMVTE